MRTTTTLLITILLTAAGYARAYHFDPETKIVDTERWGAVESSSLAIFHEAYALFTSKSYQDALEGFEQLMENKNYHLADEARWYYAESLLLANHNLEIALDFYLALAFDKNSAWANASRDKLRLPQFKYVLLHKKT